MADYTALKDVLAQALMQAESGKGHERHANGRDFTRQPILEIARMVGPGFGLGQAMKKTQEAATMIDRGASDTARRELLGAINYLASVVILMDEQDPKS